MPLFAYETNPTGAPPLSRPRIVVLAPAHDSGWNTRSTASPVGGLSTTPVVPVVSVKHQQPVLEDAGTGHRGVVRACLHDDVGGGR